LSNCFVGYFLFLSANGRGVKSNWQPLPPPLPLPGPNWRHLPLPVAIGQPIDYGAARCSLAALDVARYILAAKPNSTGHRTCADQPACPLIT